MRQNTARAVTASVVVEWYNLTYASAVRARSMLAALTAQSAALQGDQARGSVRLAAPLDLIIAFDADAVPEAQVRASVADLMDVLAGVSPPVVARFLPVPDATYCRMKNAGAERSSGEIIVFLDCDVVPEAGWLAALVGAFASPGVDVVVGNTYTDSSDASAYEFAMALAWMFPLRDPREDGRLVHSEWFYGNNLAFRREVFLARPFPDTPGLTHKPAALMVERLAADGIPIWYAAHARVSHPAPNGFRHFVKRAMGGGRARVLSDARRDWKSALDWTRRDIGTILWSMKRIVVNGPEVGMRWWQMPAVMVWATTYHLVLSFASWMTVAFPRYMENRFIL